MKLSRSGTSKYKIFIASAYNDNKLSLFLHFVKICSLFSAASKSIQIKCLSDDEGEENENSTVSFLNCDLSSYHRAYKT